VGTANFIDPAAGVKIADGLRSYTEKNGLQDVGQLVGAMESNVAFSVLHTWL
jgi:dihydroorotate dehydrogenase (NAD+) catalytic subunit